VRKHKQIHALDAIQIFVKLKEFKCWLWSEKYGTSRVKQPHEKKHCWT